MHFDEVAAKPAFGKRIAHGYLVLSAAAGLFVSPGVGPVLITTAWTRCASSSRWASATHPGRLTAKRKTDRNKRDDKGQLGQGVVAWDVEVTNQLGELVASYDILTLVAKRG